MSLSTRSLECIAAIAANAAGSIDAGFVASDVDFELAILEAILVNQYVSDMNAVVVEVVGLNVSHQLRYQHQNPYQHQRQ